MNSLVIRNETARERYLARFAKEPIPEVGLWVSWMPADAKRTLVQNNLLWVSAYTPIAQCLSEASGKVITKEHVHEVAKDRFAPRIVVEFGGKSKSYPKSTTTMGKREFSEYLEKVYAWGAELGAFDEGGGI